MRYSKQILLAVCSCLLTATAIVSAGDWPQFLGPTRDGIAPPGESISWPKAGPKVLWQRDVGQGFAGPVVSDGKVILFHRVKNLEVVECLKAEDGKQVWKHEYRTGYIDDFGFDEGPRATPLIVGGSVFTLGAAGTLSALDIATGKKLWSRDLAADYRASKGYFGFACSPLMVGDMLVLNVGADGAGIVGFDPKTGKELWKATDDEAGYSSPVIAEFGGEKRVVSFTRRGLVILDPKSGKVLHEKYWRARLNASVNAATPLVKGDEIFLSTSYQTGAILLRLKDDALTEVWSNDESLSNHFNTCVLDKGHLFGIHGRQEYGASLRCVDWATGKVAWEKKDFGCAVLIKVGENFLAMAEGGDVVMFSVDTKAYRESGRKKVLDSPVRAAPALADGRVFARDEKKLVCLQFVRE